MENSYQFSHQLCRLFATPWRTIWRFIKKKKKNETKKLGIELPYDPAISLLGILPEKTITERDTYTPTFVATLFTIARTWMQPRCPLTDEWIQRLWYIYKMECYLALKKNTFELVLVRWMNLETIVQSEVS